MLSFTLAESDAMPFIWASTWVRFCSSDSSEVLLPSEVVEVDWLAIVPFVVAVDVDVCMAVVAALFDDDAETYHQIPPITTNPTTIQITVFVVEDINVKIQFLFSPYNDLY